MFLFINVLSQKLASLKINDGRKNEIGNATQTEQQYPHVISSAKSMPKIFPLLATKPLNPSSGPAFTIISVNDSTNTAHKDHIKKYCTKLQQS